MRVAKMAILVSACIMLLATLAFAEGKMPSYGCDKQGKDCVAKCDSTADQTKGAKNYDKCLNTCSKQEENCNKRQKVATDCAETFKSCIAQAKTEKLKEDCRNAYKKCKGE